MNGHNARLGDAIIDDLDLMAVIPPSELRLLLSDFESLVAAGLLHGTRQEASQFASGWLAFEEQIGRPLPDSLRLIVLPGFGKGNA